MTGIEEKVIRFEQENEKAQKFVLGGDEHLDIILQVRNVVDGLSERFSALLTNITPDVNNLSTQQVTALIPSLLNLYSTSIRMVAILKKLPWILDVRTSAQKYYVEVENLREFIYDLENFRTSDDDELTKIIGHINDL